MYIVASFLYTLILKPAFGFLVFAKFGYRPVLSTTALPRFISVITLLLLEPSSPCGLKKIGSSLKEQPLFFGVD